MLKDSGKPFHDYVHVESGTVDRIIFSDQAIYELELERIFARAWNFMCHESQIPNKGDFFLSFIGEESVICTRDKTGALQVFLNTCRHRGNAVCRAESGNARSFLCTYHGWTYGLDGKLIGVPGYKDLYHEELDKDQWGLISAAKVTSYKGFVFATMDPEAPDLEEYLGPAGRVSLDVIAAQGPLTVVEGVQKNVVGCNWKLAVDNLFDFYHVPISHASANMSGAQSRGRSAALLNAPRMNHRVLLGEYGHAFGGSILNPVVWEQIDAAKANGEPLEVHLQQEWRKKPEVAEMLGDMGDLSGHPNIFPNLWYTGVAGAQLCLRLPKGPLATELWWFTFMPAGLSAEAQEDRRLRAIHNFGPAGLLEQDDGENWNQSTLATLGTVARRYPLNFSMGRGKAAVMESNVAGSYVETPINEHAQLWTWRCWADWMDAESWSALRASHTLPPKAGEFV